MATKKYFWAGPGVFNYKTKTYTVNMPLPELSKEMTESLLKKGKIVKDPIQDRNTSEADLLRKQLETSKEQFDATVAEIDGLAKQLKAVIAERDDLAKQLKDAGAKK